MSKDPNHKERKKLEGIIELSLDVKKDVAKCLVKGTYYTEYPDGKIVCAYFKREQCPFSEKIENRDIYICRHWTEIVGWRG